MKRFAGHGPMIEDRRGLYVRLKEVQQLQEDAKLFWDALVQSGSSVRIPEEVRERWRGEDG